MIATMGFLEHSQGGRIQFSTLVWKFMSYSFVGLIVSSVSWSSMEGKYRDALIDARVKASPTLSSPPISTDSHG